MMDPVAARAVRGWLESGIDLEFEVVSGSMRPTILAGQRVRVVPVVISTVRTGDIVVLESCGRYVVHRLICRLPQWRTAGDAAPYLDNKFDPGQIVGRVTGVLRNGHWYSMPSYPAGLPAVIRWAVASLIYRARSVIQ